MKKNYLIFAIFIIFIMFGLFSQVSAEDNSTILESHDLEKNYGENGKYSVGVYKDNSSNPVAGSEVSFMINGVNYNRTTDDKGIASLNINLNPGEYGVLTAFNNTQVNGYVHIINNDKDDLRDNVFIKGENYNKANGQSNSFAVKLTNTLGEALVNQQVIFKINDVEYTRSTDETGQAKLAIRLNGEKLPIFINFPGNSLYKPAQSSYIITSHNESKKIDVELSGNDFTQYYGENKAFTVMLSDINSNPIANQKVTISVNGVDYIRNTDDGGKAKLTIRLEPKTYTITTTYAGNELYKPASTINTQVTVLNTITKNKTKLETENFTTTFGENNAFTVMLCDVNSNPIANQKVTISVNGVDYIRNTDDDGKAKLTIRLEPKTYQITTHYAGNELYEKSSALNSVEVLNVLFIKDNLENSEIQDILSSITNKTNIRFSGNEYNNVSLNITKESILTSGTKTVLNGKLNSDVLTLKTDGILVKNININSINGSGIVANGLKNIVIKNNNIVNKINESKIDNYDLNSMVLKGNGIEISSSQSIIYGNNISYFNNGVNLKDANNNTILNNSITRNNFGIEFMENVTNTIILDNDISESIGWITFDMVEGPYGYGVSIKKSGVNITLKGNKINNNYMGVFIDAKNCSGIVIRGNEISNSTIEGLTVNENYSYAPGASLNIENNALYNNAKGPSIMILGEISANPAGIYGPGEFNDSLKLKMDPNWYGTTIYTTWGENNTGAGTLCPRIKTALIDFNLAYVGNGKYNVTFYNNGEIASELPDFDYYMTLNYYTDREQEVVMHVHEAKSTIEFSAENYFDKNNTIEGSSGSLRNTDRPFRITYTYHVDDSEIPER